MSATGSKGGKASIFPAEPRRKELVFVWALKMHRWLKHNIPRAGEGLIQDGKTIRVVPTPTPAPVAFTVSNRPYMDSGTAKLDIVNGVVFWGDAAREITPFTYPATTTLSLVHGVNHVYVDMTWAGAGTVTLARMSGSIPTPSASSYKHWLGSWTVDVGAGTIIKTFTAWPGGNIHIPAAYDG